MVLYEIIEDEDFLHELAMSEKLSREEYTLRLFGQAVQAGMTISNEKK